MTLKLPILVARVSLFDISHGIAIDFKIKTAGYIKVFTGQGALTFSNSSFHFPIIKLYHV